MLLKNLAKLKGIYMDEETVQKYGEYSCHLDDQFRVVMSLGSREAGDVFLHKRLLQDALYVDHINGNPQDNRLENLRACTLSQNQANRKLNVNNTSGYKGVRFHKTAGRWQARITFQGKELYLGLHWTIRDAVIAYNDKAFELFGEFAKLNEVPE